MGDSAEASDLPLKGIKVVEFSHMVMGPSAGLILADLGAEVVKVEPLEGDATRRLLGSGAGYFPMYNRNKKSLRLDLKKSEGVAVARDLAVWADILLENFRPGAMEKLGLSYRDLEPLNSGLIYCSAKGFLPGPYEKRSALDEVAQMMGGLAYMTGPPGRPLRAGASVIDVTGGMFGVIGVLAALEQRRRTGTGQTVDCALFETTAFLVGQHMAQKAVTGVSAQPMPARVSAWAIYDVFETLGGEQLFVGVVSDSQWRQFCATFGFDDWLNDAGMAMNNDRVARRDEIIPILKDRLGAMSKADVLNLCEAAGVAFAPISTPDELAEDPHLRASSGLVEVSIEGRPRAELPALPLRMGGRRFGATLDVPTAGQQSQDVLIHTLGYALEASRGLFEGNVVA